ncbi:Piso0_000692 [Millerozyma farinosa CBS 7064]|uniref:Piso0_000692 protein n=1 Tax=Pichia sorbitophila (strain ATCC MYA-4447 / BCRC 22081 / CBS 7064 / NBRC 10061 / NRRL Y-12695) TaxID=559304 RepID=G8YR92_PICSO|nr:Piso0_000692 [Millerozyma farinosa CBS 7064]
MAEIIYGNRGYSRLVQEINATNTVSLRLTKVLGELSEFTNTYLTTTLLPLIENVSSEDDSDLKELQNIFQQLCYVVGVDKGTQSLSVDYRQLKQIGQKVQSLENKFTQSTKPVSGEKSNVDVIGVNDGDLSNYGEQYEAVVNALSNFVYLYLVIYAYAKRSNELIFNTILYKDQLAYWNQINRSTLHKLVYLLQISPIRLFDLGKSILHNFRDIVESSVEQDPVANVQLLLQTTQDTIYKSINAVPSFSINRVNSTAFSKAKLIYQTPINIINNEIDRKVTDIKASTKKNYQQLGLLIDNLPEKVPQNLHVPFSNLKGFGNIDLLDSRDESELNVKGLKASTKVVDLLNQDTPYKDTRPRRLVRYWPILLITLLYGPKNVFLVYQNRREIFDWIRFNIVDTTVGFFKNWVIKPVNNMMSILRNDEGSGWAITSKDSLQSDLDSLERMVVDFAKDYGPNETSAGAAGSSGATNVANLQEQIRQAVSKGDMTAVMSSYERDLRSPLRSAVRGSLVRALLIQLQKTKVDGQMALNGINKMLRSQQLVFGVVAISPSLLILYSGYLLWNISRHGPVTIGGKQSNYVCLSSLNTIERLLSGETSHNKLGQLLVETVSLRFYSSFLIPPHLVAQWTEDLNELLTLAMSSKDTRRTLDRIWHTYRGFFH